MTLTRVGALIKELHTVAEMWEKIKADATDKNTLYLIDVEEQLATMKLTKSSEPYMHFTELKQHFELMVNHHDNLLKMGSAISTTQLSTMIMSSLPSSY